MFTSNIFQSHLQIEAELLAEQFDLTIIFQGTTAKTDNKTIWLPSLPENIDEKISRIFRGYLAHEVGHCRYTDWIFHRNKIAYFETVKKDWKRKGQKGDIPDEVKEPRSFLY